MSKVRFLIAMVFSALALSVLTMPARATVMTEVALDDMVRGADAIVRGTVTRAGVRMQFEGGRLEPYSLSDIRVDEWISGTGSEHVVVHERGGEWRGGGHWIDGTPRYRVGEEVIVFLVHASRGDSTSAHPIYRTPIYRTPIYRTMAMAQGKFIVLRGVPGSPGQVRRDLEGMSFAHWNAEGMQLRGADEDPVMALDTFLARIRAVLGTYGDATGTDRVGGAR